MINGFDNSLAFLWFFILPILFYFKNKRRTIKLYLNSILYKQNDKNKIKDHLSKFPTYFLLFSFICLVLALSRPYKLKNNTQKAIDIAIVFDVSASMSMIIDFKPNRLEAAKNILSQFVNKIDEARYSLIIFGSNAYTLIPFTFDKKNIINNIQKISSYNLDEEFYMATAIGDALMKGILQFKNSTTKSKVIILVTDGDNNSGMYEPILASDIAKKYGIIIYTIGIGKKGIVEIKDDATNDIIFGYSNINEDILRKISENTKGAYFNAENEEEFSNTLNKIYNLEKSQIRIYDYNAKIYLSDYFIVISFIFFSLYLILRNTIYIKIP
jgi:Ca-activated chloride channel family protein